MEPDILIIGAGIFGISTAYHLALQSSNPSSITILDRAPAPSIDAASTDVNKIIRADYSNPLYMRLGLEAIDAWKNNPLLNDAAVYHQTGWIMMNERDSGLAERIRANFRDLTQIDALQSMTEDEVRRDWGGLLREADLSPFDTFFFNPLAGWADAGRALELMADEAVHMGVRYQVGEASRLLLGDNGIEGVQTKSGDVYTADRVLLCTGAWTSQLMAALEADLNLPDEECVESQMRAAGVCVAHVQLTEAERQIYNQLPVYVYGGQGRLAACGRCAILIQTQTDDTDTPGEVIPPTDSGLLKFTNSTSFTNTIEISPARRVSAPPPHPDYADVPEKSQNHQMMVPQLLAQECIDSIRPRLPRIFENNRRIDYFRICWDAITPDQHPVISRHPHQRLANLYMAFGGSFHCWKFLPTIGRYVANMLKGVSNGADYDEAWAWKKERKGQGVHDKLIPSKEFGQYNL